MIGQPEKTAEAITSDGWMRTGDMAVIDDEGSLKRSCLSLQGHWLNLNRNFMVHKYAGYCKITGRYKDVVIRGGEKIFPLEVEQLLYKHPDIQDVQVQTRISIDLFCLPGTLFKCRVPNGPV